MNKIRLCFLLLILLLMLPGAQSEECTHAWQDYSLTEHTYDETEPFLEPFDDDLHAVTRHFPQQECVLCGATQGFSSGSGWLESHSYEVKSWTYAEGEQAVTITWQCCQCAHEYTQTALIADIASGMYSNCLLGGACNENIIGYMDADGHILPGRSEDETIIPLWTRVVHNADMGVYLLAYRVYCPKCGRPLLRAFSSSKDTEPLPWPDVDMVTEQEFLTIDMPANLPYQLIEQLLSQQPAP